MNAMYEKSACFANKSSERQIVLYVEDNEWNAKLMPDALFPLSDVEVRVARTGQRGLQMARELQPALIILDIHLPDMTGFELLRILRQDGHFRSTPIFALTADVLSKNQDDAGQCSFDAFLTKPFKLVDLQNQVAAALRDAKRRKAA